MTTTTDTSESSEALERREERRELFRALFLCLLAVVVVRSFLVEPFKIPSSSMVPTLKIGDHIFVSKFNFGLSIPFTKFEFIRWSGPKRGDVIVFLFPRDESLHYVKRVIGLPGDKVEVRGRDVFVNGELFSKEPITDPGEIEAVMGTKNPVGELFKEKIGDTTHYVRYSKSGIYDFQRGNQIETVPDDRYYVMGDNRDDSYDSRFWGPVPRENIKGRAQIVWLSLNQEEAWGTFDKVRWNRCGTIIH